MALLACHTLRHSFNATQYSRQQEQRAAVGLFASRRHGAAPLEPAQQSSQVQRLRTSEAVAQHADTTQETPSASSRQQTGGDLTVEQLQEVVAANLPVFYFHPEEKYFPCTVEWFLHRCQLALIRKGWRRQILALMAKQGSLDGQQLEQAQEAFNNRPVREQRRQFMLLQLDAEARKGQPVPVNQIPIYAHVKEVVGPKGSRDAVEINYMKFLAYNGSYKPFGWIPAGDLGAHDADWEHVTVRLSADAQHLLGAYYSAHRHRDGVWRSADELPLTQDQRIQAHIALDGHGSYPEAGWIPRVFFAFNDQTSNQGLEWRPDHVAIVTPPGPLPQVPNRGASLNGSVLPALGRRANPAHGSNGSSKHAAHRGNALSNGSARSSSAGRIHSRNVTGDETTKGGYAPSAVMQASPWLAFRGRWGSSVEAPAMQEWFCRAENPISRTWLQQVFLPLAPGIDMLLECGQEQVEEAVDDFQEAVDKLQEAMDGNMDRLKDNFEESSEEVRQRYHAAMRALMRADDKVKGEHKHEEVFRRVKAALEAASKSKDRDDRD